MVMADPSDLSHGKNEMTKTYRNYPRHVLQLTFSPKTVKKIVLSLKKCCKNPIWQTMKHNSILAESGRGTPSMAEKADGSNGTIVPFITFDNSRRDNETCWLLEVRSLTNTPDSVILSAKTKDSMIPQVEGGG